MNKTEWMKELSISNLVPTLESRAFQGTHITVLISGAEFSGKRPRSIIAATLEQADQAEYLIRKTKEDPSILNRFREWIELSHWVEEKESYHSYAFFIGEAQSFWMKLDSAALSTTEVIVAETWHLKPLLNLVTRSDAKTIRHAIKTFNRAKMKRRASDTLSEITQYALNGQVKTLMVSSARKVWGELNRWNGKLNIHSNKMNSHDDDLLDDLAEIVMGFQGRVLVVPDEWMPTVSPVAAILK